MKILLYYKTGCPWAAAVMNFLDERGLDYEERNVSLNPEFAREVEEKSGRNKSPTLDIDGEILADTDVQEVAEYLDSGRREAA